ncbi:serine/threonine-protein kinase TIO-like [Rutidosis leptorrhynchoides]|uniref:serine/threonine-protein kinase TIO-like n=1 Tax=Rutidosis leptorrhynchoides TaxID=125765 RepID=UPI003A9A5D80
MCKHSSYFYSLLAKHNIISLLVDRLFDKDTNPRVSVYAIMMISKHSDLFYEDLRVCIPQLAKLLVSAESTNLTKKNVAGCLNHLSAHSNKLCEDMISKGAIEALLKVVADYADVALDQCKIDYIIEFPLYKVVEALATMCQHLPCSNFIGSIDVLPVFGKLCESPNKDIAGLATLILKRAIKS